MAVPVAPHSPARVRLVLDVEERPGRWLLDEDDMPEIPLHDAIIELLKLILRAFVARRGVSGLVAHNLACRWDPLDARIGVDPDVVLIEPAPPGGERLASLRVWEDGHSPPRLAVEVVSAHTATKDYVDAPLRYARLGASELWVFDPLLTGPTEGGGPHLLQLFRREPDGTLIRVYAGDGPAESTELGAWVVLTEGATRLRIADDAAGTRLWPTEAEAEAAHARAETERAADLEAEVLRLRAELARRGS